MPATATEKFRGRSGSRDARQIVYIVRGTTDDEVAIATPADTAAAPATWNGLLRDDENTSIEEIGYGLWLVTVPYKTSATQPDVGEASFEFSFQAASEHIFQSLETVGSYAASGTAPDFNGAINVRYEDGRPVVEGVQLPNPTETFSYDFAVDPATVNSTYILGVGALCGRGVKNSASWTYNGVTFPAETLRLVSVRGGLRSEDRFQIRFGFSYQKNETGLTIGGISLIDKKGHDLLWALYEDDEDQNRLIKTPAAIYVERVFDKASFSALGFGT